MRARSAPCGRGPPSLSWARQRKDVPSSVTIVCRRRVSAVVPLATSSASNAPNLHHLPRIRWATPSASIRRRMPNRYVHVATRRPDSSSTTYRSQSLRRVSRRGGPEVLTTSMIFTRVGEAARALLAIERSDLRVDASGAFQAPVSSVRQADSRRAIGMPIRIEWPGRRCPDASRRCAARRPSGCPSCASIRVRAGGGRPMAWERAT
jgi:hypothetical protein